MKELVNEKSDLICKLVKLEVIIFLFLTKSEKNGGNK
jgi:hypothetical protein